MLVEVERDGGTGNAITSVVYVDGKKFSYGLEKKSSAIPDGTFTGYLQKSPKFQRKLLYIKVPNRTGILFHGGNTIAHTEGCVLVGSKRDGNTISGNMADALAAKAAEAIARGENIAVSVKRKSSIFFFAIAGIAAGYFIVRQIRGND